MSAARPPAWAEDPRGGVVFLGRLLLLAVGQTSVFLRGRTSLYIQPLKCNTIKINYEK